MRKPLPQHLADMTQAKWDSLSQVERERLRDMSECHPALLPHVGKTVRIHPARTYGASKFRVGITTGWRPALLAMRANARGSSDLISVGETIDRVEIVSR